jgi:hypothetical protein
MVKVFIYFWTGSLQVPLPVSLHKKRQLKENNLKKNE